MNTGLGFSEILVVLFVIVLFFGSKELPRFVREIASFMAKARKYSDRVRRELDDLSRPLQESTTASVPKAETAYQKKKKLREEMRKKRDELSAEDRREKSRKIAQHLKETDVYKSSSAVMIYASIDHEVETHDLIQEMMDEGKRVIVPYCIPGTNELGIAQIEDVDRDLEPGSYGIPEPIQDKRDNFFRSDLKLVVCPGVAFDRQGGRLGRGKGCYDGFMGEVKGRIPVYALAFDNQVLDDPIPFDYHDMPVDLVITELGPVAAHEPPEDDEPEDELHEEQELQEEERENQEDTPDLGEKSQHDRPQTSEG